ncbi:alpha/beta hydrolase [Lactiplantibacillus paraplantarum]|uniref:alpha/beta hydrolase n=1 Tax=Lactiplantibacillus paraplantarum TaxID=60520 RepID=UPI0023AB00EA|nr:alpha/beta hydrolase [Lactiplantibacillus paraplantarum]WEE34670.1 alpha/beta hydrolase [Lactiplantibacillus paraplantarum]
MLDQEITQLERVTLEPAAAALATATDPHPRIYELPPVKGRAILDQLQDSPVTKANVDIADQLIDTGQWGTINVRFVRPAGNYAQLPVIFYIHGAGWVFGDAHTHDKLIRELAVRTNSMVVFPEYNRSPEARYPVAIEQNYAVLQQLPALATDKQFDATRLTVAGDSVGGNMATVMTIMTKQRQGVPIKQQLLYYPVTDANFDTPSYQEFAEHYYLTKAGMEWFWDQYLPDQATRQEVTASPLQASQELLTGMPAAMILTDQADVLRDEGEAYAAKLRAAGVTVTQARLQGMVHDFVMLNSLDQTNATRAAMDLSTTWINQRNN